MAQTAQRLALDLADTFARQAEFLADFFERMAASVEQTEAQAQDAGFARRQRVEQKVDFLVEHFVKGALRGAGQRIVFDEMPELAVLVFADRTFQTERLPGDTQHPADFAR